jgi:hypothetical protein
MNTYHPFHPWHALDPVPEPRVCSCPIRRLDLPWGQSAHVVHVIGRCEQEGRR